MKKQLKIKTNVKYCELRSYKKRFDDYEVSEIAFQMYLDGLPFSAILKYGFVESRSRYDRKKKFKIYFDGIAKNKNEIEVIEKLYDIKPSKHILMMEMLYLKDTQEIIRHENGKLEYHFVFSQY